MKKSITYLVIFLFTLVTNKAVSQTASINVNAIVRIAEPLELVKNSDLNFGTVSSSSSAGSVIIAPDGTVTTFGGVTIIDQSLISAASFGVFGPANTSFTITLPGYVELKNELNPSIALYGMNSNPSGTGTLSSTGTATLLVGASITVNASQGQGIYQGDFEITVNLN